MLEYVKLLRRLLVIFLFFLFFSGAASWFVLGKPWFMPTSFAVGQLEKVVPRLEQDQITTYRNQNWCKTIAYSYGQFSETTHATTCNLFAGEARAFDDKARASFTDLRQSLLFTGVNISFLNAYFEEDKLRQAEFKLSCWLCSRTRYVYKPGYVLPEDMGTEMWFYAISKNWYRVNEDWN